jgi:PKD repeat protein
VNYVIFGDVNGVFWKYGLSLFLALQVGVSWAQSGLVLTGNFKSCPPVPAFVVNPQVQNYTEFEEGSFTVDWGDGSSPLSGLTYAQVQALSHTYNRGKFSILTISAKRISDGQVMTAMQEVINEPPAPALVAGTGAMDPSSCLGESDAHFIIGNYQNNSSATQYKLMFGDGGEETYSQDEIAGLGGNMTYSFSQSHCEAGAGAAGYVITITAINACGTTNTQTVQGFYVYQKPKAKFFLIDEYGWEQTTITACAGYPFVLRNNTEPEMDFDCKEVAKVVEYTWTFQNGKRGAAGDTVVTTSSREFDFTYDKAGTYAITLEAPPTNCGDGDTKTVYVTVRDSVKADFTYEGSFADDSDSLCAGPVKIRNTSKEAEKYDWRIINIAEDKGAAEGFSFLTGDTSSADIEVTFGPGSYLIVLEASNHCSKKLRIDTLHVKANSWIKRFDPLPDFCPGSTLSIDSSGIEYEWVFPDRPEQPTWTVTGGNEGTDWEWANGSDAHDTIPYIRFINHGKYVVTATLSGVGCGSPSSLNNTLVIYDPAIDIQLAPDRTELCEAESLIVTNTSTGVNLQRPLWYMLDSLGHPASNFSRSTIDDTRTKFTFNRYGKYTIKGIFVAECSRDTAEIEVLVKKAPSVTLSELSPICPDTLDFKDFVSYVWNGNPRAATWTITPDVADGFKFIDATPADTMPRIAFVQKGSYQIRVEVDKAGCAGSSWEAEQVLTVVDSAITLNIVPERTELGEDSVLRFSNATIGESLSYSWSVTPASGSGGFDSFDTQAASPEIRFTRWGNYTVSVNLEGPCSRRGPIEFPIVVHGIPAFTFSQSVHNFCTDKDTELDLASFMACDSAGNDDIRCQWRITPAVGYTFTTGTETDMYPKIRFDQPGVYTLSLESETKFGGVRTTPPLTVNVLSAQVEASAGLSALSGCVDDRFLLTLTNTSTGDSLNYRWEITPVAGWSGDLLQESPVIELTGVQEYTIVLKAENRCGEDTAHYRVRAYGKPEVETLQSNLIRDVCETDYLFKGVQHVGQIRENGDAITYQKWTVSPEGYTWENGTDEKSARPDLSFAGGKSYEVKGAFKNGCADTVSVFFTVSVDRFDAVSTMNDTAVCALTEPFLLAAKPAGGVWSALSGDVVRDTVSDEYRFDPRVDAAATYILVYTKGTLSCVARDTLEVSVHKLPELSLGTDPEMCLNHLPRDLTPSLNPGGEWSGAGITDGKTFRPELTGTGLFRLTYRYGDPVTGCVVSDSIGMTVHPLPDPSFSIGSNFCSGQPARFIPAALGAGHRFSWDFGDGSPRQETRDASVTHQYQDPDQIYVQAEAISVFGCRDTSEPVQVAITAQPPAAEFGLDKTAGCGPLDVNVAVNAGLYADTTLSFAWRYGNGQLSTDLQPGPLRYLATAEDTTYRIEFSVFNRCDTVRKIEEIRVGSHPKASFAMMNRYECSPVEVPFVNRSTGTGNEYYWNFGDGAGTTDRDPDHTYYAEGTAQEYTVTLSVKNGCSQDSVSKKLLIRPNTIRPLFSMDNRRVCARQEVRFDNYSTDRATGDATGFVDYYWDFGDGNIAAGWDASHTYTRAGVYHVSLFLDNGCGFSEKSDSITVYALPEISMTGDVAQCKEVPLNFSIESSERLRSVEWNMGDDSVHYSQIPFDYTYRKSGQYTVTVSVKSANSAGCPAFASRQVEIWPEPDVRIEPLDTMACPPFLYAPRITGSGVYFKWDYGTGEGLSADNSHTYRNQAGTESDYWITAYAETGKGCKGEYKGHVRLYPQPVAAFSKEIFYGRPERVLFINDSQGETRAEWTLPNGHVEATMENVEYAFTGKGQYPVSLLVENEYGCRDTVTGEHHAFKSGLYFPDTFVPHSENGAVNNFRGIGMGLKEYHLEVLDLYGNKIWESRILEDGMPAEGWDGTNPNGELLPQGVYMWRAKAVFFSEDVWTGSNNPSGQVQSTQGAVLLLRK